MIRNFNWSTDEEIRLAGEVINCIAEHSDERCPAGEVEYYRVSALLASNPLTPAAVLDHMSRYLNQPKLLERVAANTNSPSNTLKQLARNKSALVRAAVAEADNLDRETLWLLARDEDLDVRFTLAENYFVPLEILDELAADENPYVAYRAELTKKRLSKAAGFSEVEELPRGEESRMRRVV